MDDLISRQALMKEFVVEYRHGTTPAFRWIPCAEALPTESDHKDGVVLACNYNGQIRFNACMDGRWVLEEPIAWMSLPEPYEEEQDEQGAG